MGAAQSTLNGKLPGEPPGDVAVHQENQYTHLLSCISYYAIWIFNIKSAFKLDRLWLKCLWGTVSLVLLQV